MTAAGRAARPNAAALDAALRLLEPWRVLVDPVFVGLDRVPDERPLLFVGNHTLVGVLDTPFLFAELWRRKRIFLRALGDHAHFRVPLWREFLTGFGVVDGTRENCRLLMRAGEALLVFPGGGREVAKRKGEKYRLLWKERLGFARMAIEHACTVVPFAAVGVEDALDIVADAEDLLATPLGAVVRRLGVRTAIIPPLVRGIGRSPLPRPERLYFGFGAPIRTAAYGRRADDDAACRELRDRVRQAVEDGIAALRRRQAADPHRRLGARVARGLARARRGNRGATRG